jgi:hypothetical protein
MKYTFDIMLLLSFDLNPPPLVEDPDRFYRSGEKKRYKENIEI